MMEPSKEAPSFSPTLPASTNTSTFPTPKKSLVAQAPLQAKSRYTIRNPTGIAKESHGESKVQQQQQQEKKKQQQHPHSKVYVKPKPKQLTLGDLIPTTIPQVEGKSNENVLNEVAESHLIISSSAKQHQSMQRGKHKIQTYNEADKLNISPTAIVKTKHHPKVNSSTSSQGTAASSSVNRTAVACNIYSGITQIKKTNAATESRRNANDNTKDVVELFSDPTRFVCNNNAVITFTNKGKPNRLKPRKKKLTSLKKRILMERLQKWKKSQGLIEGIGTESAPSNLSLTDAKTSASVDTNYKSEISAASSSPSKIVCLVNFIDLEHDDISDEDEYSELCLDLCRLAGLIGPINGVCIPRSTADDDDTPNSSLIGLAFVYFQSSIDAQAARYCWKGMVLGGRAIDSLLVVSSNDELVTQTFSSSSSTSASPKIALYNTLNEDDLTDTECMEETFCDIRQLVSSTSVPLSTNHNTMFQVDRLYGDECGILIDFFHDEATTAIISVLNALDGRTFSGKPIFAELLVNLKLLTWSNNNDHLPVAIPTPLKSYRQTTEDDSKVEAMHSPTTNLSNDNTEPHTLVLLKLFSDDHIDDEVCFDKRKEDVRLFVSKYGEVSGFDVCRTGANRGNVLITCKGGRAATITTAKSLNGKVYNGEEIHALVATTIGTPKHDDGDIIYSYLPKKCDANVVRHSTSQTVVLSNILSDDDLEDDECLDECKEDILSMVRKYGEVTKIDVNKEGSDMGKVLITYATPCAHVAAAKLNGLNIGGKFINAAALGTGDSLSTNVVSSSLLGSEILPLDNTHLSEATFRTIANNYVPPEPIFSKSGKLIPERWAECKRVPKVGNSCLQPDYVHLLNDEIATPLLLEMLGSLMKFQLRSKDDANARSRRRLVLGFREVARGLRAKKIKLVVLAKNLDEYEAVSEKTQEVLDICEATETPILFELSKRQLGKALGKTIKISIVGVQNVDGAHEQFKKLKAIVESESRSRLHC